MKCIRCRANTDSFYYKNKNVLYMACRVCTYLATPIKDIRQQRKEEPLIRGDAAALVNIRFYFKEIKKGDDDATE